MMLNCVQELLTGCGPPAWGGDMEFLSSNCHSDMQGAKSGAASLPRLATTENSGCHPHQAGVTRSLVVSTICRRGPKSLSFPGVATPVSIFLDRSCCAT